MAEKSTTRLTKPAQKWLARVIGSAHAHGHFDGERVLKRFPVQELATLCTSPQDRAEWAHANTGLDPDLGVDFDGAGIGTLIASALSKRKTEPNVVIASFGWDKFVQYAPNDGLYELVFLQDGLTKPFFGELLDIAIEEKVFGDNTWYELIQLVGYENLAEHLPTNVTAALLKVAITAGEAVSEGLKPLRSAKPVFSKNAEPPPDVSKIEPFTARIAFAIAKPAVLAEHVPPAQLMAIPKAIALKNEWQKPPPPPEEKTAASDEAQLSAEGAPGDDARPTNPPPTVPALGTGSADGPEIDSEDLPSIDDIVPPVGSVPRPVVPLDEDDENEGKTRVMSADGLAAAREAAGVVSTSNPPGAPSATTEGSGARSLPKGPPPLNKRR